MPEIKYDPELPIWVSYSSGDRPIARFRHRVDANRYRDLVMSEGVVIDTTPKPKIPEDAHHITWGTETPVYSLYLDDLWYGCNHGHGLSDEELLEMIGDSEVTVLVRKEET